MTFGPVDGPDRSGTLPFGKLQFLCTDADPKEGFLTLTLATILILHRMGLPPKQGFQCRPNSMWGCWGKLCSLLVVVLCSSVQMGTGNARAEAGTGPALGIGKSNEPQAAQRPIPVVLGRMGSKARAATPDLPKRLREAISKDLAGSPEVLVLDEARSKEGRFSIESSITELSRRTNAAGEMEVTCEVSMVIGLMPSRAIVGMTSGGATIQRGSFRGRLTKAQAIAMEADALSHAVHGANLNLLDFLRNQR